MLHGTETCSRTAVSTVASPHHLHQMCFGSVASGCHGYQLLHVVTVAGAHRRLCAGLFARADNHLRSAKYSSQDVRAAKPATQVSGLLPREQVCTSRNRFHVVRYLTSAIAYDAIPRAACVTITCTCRVFCSFQKVPPGYQPFTIAQRLGAVVRNGGKLLAVGTVASLVGVGATDLLISTRQVLAQSQRVLAVMKAQCTGGCT